MFPDLFWNFYLFDLSPANIPGYYHSRDGYINRVVIDNFKFDRLIACTNTDLWRIIQCDQASTAGCEGLSR